MRAKVGQIMAFGLLVLTAFAASACGTLEIEREPATGMAEPDATATALPLPTATEMQLATPTVLLSPTPTRSGQDEETIWNSEITSLDETWNRYTSNGQGFSIKFPKTMATLRGSCTWNEEQGSYRPEMALVPVKVFEDADAVYIAPEHYYELTGERTDDSGIRYFDACNQVNNSLELLRVPENQFKEPFWKLVVAKVHDDAELESFIKVRYGSGCGLKEQVPSAQDGVYDIAILGDGKSLEETECPLNFGTVVKYFPAGNKVVAWDTGQAATFPVDVNYTVTHDQEMIDSFSFLDTAALTPVEPTEPGQGWRSYANTEYGFSFEYPASWTVAEVNDKEFVEPGSRSVQLSQGSVTLVIGYRRAGEQTQIAGSGMPAGAFEERGAVRMLDQDVPRQVLVFEGKDKGMYYNGWSVIIAGDLEFTASLHDFAQIDYGQIALPVDLQDEADDILSTLKVVASPTGAVEPTPAGAVSLPNTELTGYSDDDFGFTFEYPADWALEVILRRALEGACPGDAQWLPDAIVLNQGKLVIPVQFMYTSAAGQVGWDGRVSGGGLAQEADVELVNLIGQDASKWV